MQTIVAVLPYIQIGLSILLIALVLMQRSDADLGSAFGSDPSMGGTRYARRGSEKFFFNLTIIIAVLFVASALIAVVFHAQ